MEEDVYSSSNEELKPFEDLTTEKEKSVENENIEGE